MATSRHGYYYKVYIKIPCVSSHTMFRCSVRFSKQTSLFPSTALSDWFQSRGSLRSLWGRNYILRPTYNWNRFPGRAVAQEFSRWLFTTEAWIRPQVNPCEFYCEQTCSGTGVFSHLLRFSTVTVIPPMLHTHLRLHVLFLSKKQRQSLGIFQKTTSFRTWAALKVKGNSSFVRIILFASKCYK